MKKLFLLLKTMKKFRHKGYFCVLARNGEEAFQVLKRIDISERVSLIVLNIKNQSKGIAFLEKIQNFFPDIYKKIPLLFIEDE